MGNSGRIWALLVGLVLLLPLLAAADDRDGNGLDDALEDDLLRRFAPVVLLAPSEWAKPANVDWYLARARLDPELRPEVHITQASLLGNWDALLARVHRSTAVIRPAREARGGSADPRDWIVYGHVYPGQGGGVLLQYWFFYPFNDGHLLFDHEGDWEHVTVRLDPALRPRGAWYSRHDDNAPGRWFAWYAIAREGDHPVVLSAKGTHASYARVEEVPWYDSTCKTRDPARAEREGCRPWRTWSAGETGGIVSTGQRARPRPRAWFIAWPGRWGAKGWLGHEGGTPPGPAFQRGWCVYGGMGCR